MVPIMRAEGTFSVASFVPASVEPPPVAIEVGLPVGTAVMEKVYEGEVSGRSATIFTSAFDMGTGVGTYVALETFEGRLGERSGGFVYVHSATTTGSDRSHELFLIVPTSGVGELAGISGAGGMDIDPDDTHHIWFDYDLD
jgi:Protein of unknown function (DUF3224)